MNKSLILYLYIILMANSICTANATYDMQQYIGGVLAGLQLYMGYMERNKNKLSFFVILELLCKFLFFGWLSMSNEPTLRGDITMFCHLSSPSMANIASPRL